MHRTARHLIAAVLASLLVACGGGDPEDEHVDTPGVDCKARPELCN